MGDVLDFDVLAHGILTQVLSKIIFVSLINVNPVLHIGGGLAGEARLHDDSIKHGLTFDREKAGVEGCPIRALIEQSHVLCRCVLQEVCGVSTPNRQDSPIG